MRSFLRDLLLAIPAALMLLSVTGVAVGGFLQQRLYSRYADLARAAFRAEDYGWALKCYLKAEPLGDFDRQLIYEKAICLARLKSLDAARETMQNLSDKHQYEFAQMWLIGDELSRQPPSAERLAELETVLDDILRRYPQVIEGHRLAAEVKNRSRGLEAALPHIRTLAQIGPEDRLRLALVYRALKREDDARAEFVRVREQVDALLKKQPDNLLTRRVGVQACVLSREFEPALKLLQDASARQGMTPPIALMFAGVFFAWGEDLDRGAEPNPREAVRKWLAAAQFRPPLNEAYQRLASFALREGPAGKVARQALFDAASSGQSLALIHLLLGLHAWRHFNTIDAERHWAIAFDSDPAAPALMNNLAWGVEWQAQPDHELALKMVNLALERSPESPQLRHTRGQVLYKLGQAEEALAELHAAEKELKDDWRLHLALAEVYQSQNEPQRANQHRLTAQKLLAAQSNQWSVLTQPR